MGVDVAVGLGVSVVVAVAVEVTSPAFIGNRIIRRLIPTDA